MSNFMCKSEVSYELATITVWKCELIVKSKYLGRVDGGGKMSVWVGSGGGEVRQPAATATLMSTNTSMESGIEAGVLPTVTGSLASARDSLGSLSRAAEPLYDTDHTDLGSELDEAEIRRELMHDVSPIITGSMWYMMLKQRNNQYTMKDIL